MKPINILFLCFAIFGIAIIGCLYIFDMRDMDQSLDLLLKAEGAIFLIWGCSAAISLLLGGAKKPAD